MSDAESTSAQPAAPSAPNSAPASAPAPAAEHKYLAPWWHTICVLLFLAALSLSGYITTRQIATPNSKAHPTEMGMMATYAGTFVLEWVLFFFVRWGERRYRKTTLAERVGGSWALPEKFWTDIGLGAGTWLTLGVVGVITNSIIKPKGAVVLSKLLPKTIPELAFFIVIAASAGFCEEYLFRGYLQDQFRLLTGSAWAAIAIQAAIFGVSHGYQGAGLMVSIFFYGIILGAVVKWRKSLRPGMVAHFGLDSVSGVLGFFLHMAHRI